MYGMKKTLLLIHLKQLKQGSRVYMKSAVNTLMQGCMRRWCLGISLIWMEVLKDFFQPRVSDIFLQYRAFIFRLSEWYFISF